MRKGNPEKIAKLTPMVRFQTAPGLKKKNQKFRQSDNLCPTKSPWHYGLALETKKVCNAQQDLHKYLLVDWHLLKDVQIPAVHRFEGEGDGIVATVRYEDGKIW